MGIFNMLSSLCYALALQFATLYFDRRSAITGVVVRFQGDAHSDDSDALFKLLAEMALNDCLDELATLQKCAGHLYSEKKCLVSKVYLEFLSILYVMERLLPMLPKFIQNTKFTPSGKGIAQDMRTIISKVIELLNNGITISAAYKFQVIASNMVLNFYRMPELGYTPSVGSMPNSMPHLYSAYGAMVDEVRMMVFNPDKYAKQQSFLSTFLDCEVESGVMSMKMAVKKFRNQSLLRIIESIPYPDDCSDDWFWKENKTNHAYLNLYWYKANLKSDDFALSMLNINEVKRYLDSLVMSSTNSVVTNSKVKISLTTMAAALIKHEIADGSQNLSTLLNSQYQGLIDYLKWSDSVGGVITKDRDEMLTLKPCQLIITAFNDIPIVNPKSMVYAVGLCEPNLMKYTYSEKIPEMHFTAMKEYLTRHGVSLKIKDVKTFIDFANKSKDRHVYMYTSLPSNERLQYNEEGLHRCFSNNLHPKYVLKTDTAHYMDLSKKTKYIELAEITPEDVSIFITASVIRRTFVSKGAQQQLSSQTKLNDLPLNKIQDYPLQQTYRELLKIATATLDYKDDSDRDFDLKDFNNWAL